jgi:cob(I)alamin adenosyltransferase
MPEELKFDMVTTKGGDKGSTSLFDGTRVPKDNPLIQFLGAMDSFTSFLGLAKAKIRNHPSLSLPLNTEISDFIHTVQKEIIILNGMAASPGTRKPDKFLNENSVYELEKYEKHLMDQISIEPKFIIQGVTELSSYVDIARSFCRQGERRIVSLITQDSRLDLRLPQKYLNRLADVLYIIARYIDQVMK